MKPVLLLCALHSFGLAVFHTFFWKIFNWREDLKRSSVSTRAIIQIANLRLIFLFLLIGYLCLRFPEELSGTPLGRALMGGMALFWLGRTIEQFIFLPYNKPIVHVLTVVFALGTVLFALPLF